MSDEPTELEPAEDSPGARLRAASEANSDRMVRMERQGVEFNEVELLKVRLDTLSEFAVGRGLSMLFEMQYQQALHEYLNAFESQLARQQLTAGVQIEVPRDLRT